MKERWGKDGLRPRSAVRPAVMWHKLGALLAIGLIVGVVSMAGTAAIYKNSLRTRVNTIAESIDGQRVTSLRDASSDMAAQDDYAYLKTKLSRIKAVNADSRFVYLMARGADGQVYFLVDSEPTGSNDYSPRGEQYPEASVKLKAMFDNGRSLIEGPSNDSYGNWLSALAPIIDDQSYRLTAVVGIDVPATSYALLLGLAGGIPVLLALLAAVMIYVQQQIRRRHEQHIQFRAEMISIASHELRTPLTGLRWSGENLLSQKLGGASQRRAIEIMYDSTRRLQDSIEDILQLASLESGAAQRLYKKEVDLHDIADDIVAMQRLAAERHNISLTFAASWPKRLLVECDAQRIKRVLNNIVGNAVKYSNPDTTIVIGYSRSKDGAHVISVQDHGIGIPADEQAKVWQGFYRAKNTASHDVTGTGMGLYLARTIIEQHQGRIWLESTEDKGTTVFVELPDTIHDSKAS